MYTIYVKKAMYKITDNDMISAINAYNTGKNNNLEYILTNLNLSTLATREAIYIPSNGLLDEYELTTRLITTIYYTTLAVDWVRIWYDAYTMNKLLKISIIDDIDDEYILDASNIEFVTGFTMINHAGTFRDRSDSKILQVVDIPVLSNDTVDYITNLVLDYMESPSTEHVDKLNRDSSFNYLPNEFLHLYALALRTFQHTDKYVHIIPYLFNMLLTIIYTSNYGYPIDVSRYGHKIAMEYIQSLSEPDLNIITEIDQLSKYVNESPELDSVQQQCMHLVRSISKIRTDNKSILGLWRGISTGRKIGSESVFGNVFLIDILNKIKVLVKTSQYSTGDVSDEEDMLSQIHEAYVGLRMNEMRQEIPNFMYCYGIQNITSPYTRSTTIQDDRSNEIVLWDDSKAGLQVPNVFLEYIDDSVSFSVALTALIFEDDSASNTLRKLTSGESAISLLTQLALALHMAYTKLGFMHNDLHINNILVRKLKNPIWIEYQYKNNSQWIYTKHLMMIIDYGQSSILDDHHEFIQSPSAIYSYPDGDVLVDILKTFMSVLSRYDLLRTEYAKLFNIFSQAFGTDDQSITLSVDQIKLFTTMTPEYQFIPPDNTPGMILYPDRFYDALINAYIELQPPSTYPSNISDNILDVNQSIQLIPQDTFLLNKLQDVILWDWIIQKNLLQDVDAVVHSEIMLRSKARSNMNQMYDNIVSDCDNLDNLIDCLDSIPNDILSLRNLSITNIAYVADIVAAYQYASVLCADKTIPDELCEYRVQLLKNTLIRIDIQAFIDAFQWATSYRIEVLRNLPYHAPQLLKDNSKSALYMKLNTNTIRSFISNIYHVDKLLE